MGNGGLGYSGQMQPIHPPEGSRSHPSGSAQQGSWITLDHEPKKSLHKRTWFVICVVLLTLMIVLTVGLLAR